MTSIKRLLMLCLVLTAGQGFVRAQDAAVDEALRAFERGQWTAAVEAYREVLAQDPADRLAVLRIAQAQRELGEHAAALETLELVVDEALPMAMADLERARNLAALGRVDTALQALEVADHNELRAFATLEEADEFTQLRGRERFERGYRSVRRRVFPCEGIAQAAEFDFWIGEWTVRLPDGTPVGESEVRRQQGGCAVLEQWQGAGGTSGTGMSFYLPSREQWRQVWAGSSGTLIDMTGGLSDGAMRMEGTIEYVAGEVVAFRGTWTPLADGRTHQLLEEFDLVSQTWRVWFEGFYGPRLESGS